MGEGRQPLDSDRDDPGEPRAAPQAAGQQDEEDAGEGVEGTGRLAHAERDVAEIGVQLAAQLHGCQGRDEVEDAAQQHDDGRHAAHRLVAPGLVDDRRPALPVGKDGDDAEVHGRPPLPDGEPLEEAAGRLVLPRELETGAHDGPARQLHEGDLPLADEDGRHPEQAGALLHDVGTGSRVGEETPPDPHQLGPQCVTGDEAGVALGDEGPGGVAGGVVRPVLRWAEEGAARPRPDAVVDDGEHDGDGDELEGQREGDVGEEPGVVVQSPAEEGHLGQAGEDGDGDGKQQPPRIAPEPAVHEAGRHEAGQAGGVCQAVDALEPAVAGRLDGGEQLGDGVMAEGGVPRIGRVGVVVEGVVAPAGLHADPLGIRSGGHVEVGGQGHLDPGGGERHHAGRVVADRPVPRTGQDDDPVPVPADVAGDRLCQLGVRPERCLQLGGGLVAQLEEVAGHDEGAGRVGALQRLGQLVGRRAGGCRRNGGEEEVSGDEDAATGRHAHRRTRLAAALGDHPRRPCRRQPVSPGSCRIGVGCRDRPPSTPR